MNKIKTLMLTLIFILSSTLPMTASADNEDIASSSTTPEVTIGLGSVTNDTMVLTMDTSVDVYAYNVTFVWASGSVYCGVQSWGGLSEQADFQVGINFAGCPILAYYPGALGERWIPSGSNGTLTSFYYESNTPEICIGSATYLIMDADEEWEYRDADVDAENCLTYTRQESQNDLWYELDVSEVETLDPNGDVVIGFGNVTNDRMSLTLENSVNIHEFKFLLYEASCTGSFTTTGLAADNDFYITLPRGSDTCEVHAFIQGSQGTGSDDHYIPANSDETLISMAYESNSQDLCIVQASYLSEVGGEWREATLDDNYCLSYTYNSGSNEWVLDADQSKVEIDQYGISEHHSVLWAIQNSPYFTTLAQALEVADLTDDISPENTPQMGWTMFMPTNDAFETAGFDLEYFETEEDIASLRDILLYHVSFGGPYGLALSCPYSLDWMPMANGGYDDPNDYSTWNQTISVENDCQDIVINAQSTVIDADNRVYGYEYNTDNDQLPYGHPVAEDNGMIQVVDTLLIPLQYRQPDVLFEFGGELDESDPSQTDEGEGTDGEENPSENETPGNETQPGVVEETDPQDEENTGEVEDETPVEWECMDGTLITTNLIDDGKFDCPDGSDEYTPFVEESSTDEPVEDTVAEASEDTAEQASESTPSTEGANVDDSAANSGTTDELQTEAEESSSEDRVIVIGGLLSFLILLAILVGTVAVSKREDNAFSSVFEEGGVAMDELLGLLGRSKMLKVIHVLNMHGEGIRFTELKTNVDTSATTLSRRLGELEEFGLVSRTELPTVPMTVIYRLTDAGLSLMPRVEGMFEWALDNGQ